MNSLTFAALIALAAFLMKGRTPNIARYLALIASLPIAVAGIIERTGQPITTISLATAYVILTLGALFAPVSRREL